MLMGEVIAVHLYYLVIYCDNSLNLTRIYYSTNETTLSVNMQLPELSIIDKNIGKIIQKCFYCHIL